MTSQRLFFALWPDDEVREALLRWQTRNLPARAKWQHRADLHMTLHFLGQVDAAQVPALSELGARCVGPGFVVTLDKTGFWPRPRVLWAGTSHVIEPLRALHRRLREGLLQLGVPVESRPYLPHVTLARGLRDEPAVEPLPALPWSVRELALVASRRAPSPVYHPVARWPLKINPSEAGH